MAAKKDGEAARPLAEVLRRRLRTALVEARLAAGRTQPEIAQALDCSKSKIVRIEQGTVPVHPTDVRAILVECGVEPERIEELVVLAREARGAPSLDDFKGIDADFREMIARERSATSIWKYEPSVVPGFFQTAEYARALLEDLGEHPRDAAVMSDLRNFRQSIFDGETVPQIHVVIGEAALRRPVGGADVMRDQIRRLIRFDERPEITLDLLMFSTGAHRSMGRPFTVLQFSEDDLHDSLYLEDGTERADSAKHPRLIEKYLTVYSELVEKAERSGSFPESAQEFLTMWQDDPS
jgi:transcriptional regulator with XRE-family HTH domain